MTLEVPLRLALALLFAFTMLTAPASYARTMDFTPDDPPALLGKPFKDKAVRKFARRLKIKGKPDGNRAYFTRKGDDIGIMFYLDGETQIIQAISINVVRFPGTIYGINASNAHVFASHLDGAIAGQETRIVRPEAVIKIARSEDNYGITNRVSYVTFSPPIPVPKSPPLTASRSFGPIHTGLAEARCTDGECGLGRGTLEGPGFKFSGLFVDGIAEGTGHLVFPGDENGSLRGNFDGGFPHGAITLSGKGGVEYELLVQMEWGEIDGTAEGMIGDQRFTGECSTTRGRCSGKLKRPGWADYVVGHYSLPGMRPHGELTFYFFDQKERDEYLPPAAGSLRGTWMHGAPNGRFEALNAQGAIVASGVYALGVLTEGRDVLKEMGLLPKPSSE